MSKRYLKAKYIHIGNGTVLKDAGLVVNQNGIIEEIGEKLSIPKEKVEHFEGILCPGFINTHCHLELSHLKGKVQEHTQLNGFIQELQSIRMADKNTIEAAFYAADKEMQNEGIVAVGDICNDPFTFKCKKESPIFYHSFIELFAYDPAKAQSFFDKGWNIKKQANRIKISASIVPHAPYSVSNMLFKMITAIEGQEPISIHNQETASENELFQKGGGKMAEMLLQFGNKKENLHVSGRNSLPTYISNLPSDKPLLLVHNTFTTKEDVEFAEKAHSNLFWCFCPNANLYIENKLPNIPMFIKSGVRITLGTDSLASNYQLSILEEMKSIQKAYPSIPTSTLIQWGTKSGAEFLGLKDFGELKVNTNPGIVFINAIENGKFSEKSKARRIV